MLICMVLKRYKVFFKKNLCWLKNWRIWGLTLKSTNGGRDILSGECENTPQCPTVRCLCAWPKRHLVGVTGVISTHACWVCCQKIVGSCREMTHGQTVKITCNNSVGKYSIIYILYIYMSHGLNQPRCVESDNWLHRPPKVWHHFG